MTPEDVSGLEGCHGKVGDFRVTGGGNETRAAR